MRSVQIGMHGIGTRMGGVDRYFAGLLSGMDAIDAPYWAAAFGVASSKPAINSLGSSQSSILGRWRKVRQFLAESRVSVGTRSDVMVSHFALYGLPAARFRLRAPFVVHFQGPWALESGREGAGRLTVWTKRRLETYVYSSAQRCIAMSKSFAELLNVTYGVPAARIRVVPGGIDMQMFRPTAGRVAARRQLGWDAKGRLVVCVRRLARRMGLENLIDAWREVVTTHPSARLVVGGRGPLEDELKSRIADYNLGDSVTFTGFIPEDRLPLVYEAADLSIVPTQDLEGFGLITLESLACGTPVLVTPVGGLPEVLRGFDPQLILPDKTTDAIRDGLNWALQSPAVLPSPEACRAYVELNYTWPSIARRVVAIYEEAAEEFYSKGRLKVA